MNVFVKKYSSVVTGNNTNIKNIIINLFFLVFLIIIFSILSPVFLSPRNIYNILNQSSIYLILGVGMTLVMATGNLDLSVGGILGLSSVFLGGTIVLLGLPWWLGILVCLISGALWGALNGFLVYRFNIPSIVLTLGTMTAFWALSLILLGNRELSFFPLQIRWITNARFLGLSPNIYAAVIIFLIGSYFLTKTATGKYLIATGADKKAASLSGVKTNLIILLPFIITGILAGISAIIFVSRINSTIAYAGRGMEFQVITAVVLGGTMIKGGKALMSGTLLGVLTIGVIENGFYLAGIEHPWQRVAIGLIFIIVVILRTLKERKQ